MARCGGVVLLKRPLSPGPSPARGEGRRFFLRRRLWAALLPPAMLPPCSAARARHENRPGELSPLSPCGRGVGGEGASRVRESLNFRKIVQPNGDCGQVWRRCFTESAPPAPLPQGERGDARFFLRRRLWAALLPAAMLPLVPLHEPGMKIARASFLPSPLAGEESGERGLPESANR